MALHTLKAHSSENSIDNHFDTSFELVATLEKCVKHQLLEEARCIAPKHVTLTKPHIDEA